MAAGPAEAWASFAELARHLLEAASGVLLLARSRRPPWDPRLFESPIRQRILDMLTTRPAIPLAELRQRLPAGWGTVHHHLSALEAAGLVRYATHAGRRVVVSQLDEASDALVRAAALMRTPALRRVANHIVHHPDCNIHDICAATGATRRVAYYHVKHLRDAGLLLLRTPTRYFELRAGPELVALLGDEHE